MKTAIIEQPETLIQSKARRGGCWGKTSLEEILFKFKLDPSLISCKESGRNSGDPCSTTPTRPMKDSMIEEVREFLLLATVTFYYWLLPTHIFITGQGLDPKQLCGNLDPCEQSNTFFLDDKHLSNLDWLYQNMFHGPLISQNE